MRATNSEAAVTDAVWLSVVTFALLGYLVYALLAPEKF